jgi:hypothetical protein
VNSRSKARSALYCVATLRALPLTAAAAEQGADQTFDWALDAGVRHSDNIERTAVDEQSESVAIAGLNLRIDAERPRLDANIGANVQYRDYLDDVFQSELVGGVDLLTTYSFVPERFSWTIVDNYGQIAEERQLAETPDNRQDVNYLTTGPDITFPFGTRTALRLSGRYSDVYYENTPEDSNSVSGAVALIRELSDNTRWSLNASDTEVDYDQEAFVDYGIREGYLRFESTGRLTTLSIDGGYTSIDQDGDKSDGLLARINLSRKVATRSRVGLRAGTEFSSAADTFRRDQQVIGPQTSNDDAIAAGDALRSDYAYVTFDTDWPRGSLVAVLNARREEHEIVTTEDRDLYGASLQLSREVSRRIEASFTGSYAKEKFVNAGFDFDEWSVGAALLWRFAAQVSLRMSVDHLEGSSNTGTRDYEENRGYIGIVYSRSRQ